MSAPQARTQTWSPERYEKNARFVSDLGMPVVELLAPRAGSIVASRAARRCRSRTSSTPSSRMPRCTGCDGPTPSSRGCGAR